MTTLKTSKSSSRRSAAKRGPSRQTGKAVTATGKRVPRPAGGRGVTRPHARGLKVRMYRVGFGDFFLVTIPTPSGDKYILIDCGVFKGTSGTGDIGSIVEAVEDMYQTIRGDSPQTTAHLSLVIMTHRHADHIAGFAKAERFKDFTASMVWMPYWEQFNDAKSTKAASNDDNDSMALDDMNAANDLLSDIGVLAENLGMLFRGREDDDAKEALAQLGNATGVEDFSAAARTKRGGLNAKALDVLKQHLGENGKKVRYYAAGDKPEVPSELVDLKATILGPPPQQAGAFMALTDLKKGVGQYLDSISDSERKPKALEPFPYEWEARSLKKDYKGTISQKELIGCRLQVDGSQPDMLTAAAAKIETFLNNQSLVVLFEFGGKKLLFAGDAQAGNWEYWLYRTKEPLKDPTKAGDIIKSSKEVLQTIDFYKVGHHGSTNATPIQAVEAAVKRRKTKGFVSMCSTEDGVYGNPKKDTEVPRTRLLDVLRKGSCLVRSDAIKVTVTTPKKKVIKPAKGVKLPEPKVGELTTSPLYIEYSF